MFSSESLDSLVATFKRLPGVGQKSAQRIAFFLLEHPEEVLDSLISSLRDARRSIRLCRLCRNLSDTEVCAVCSDPGRDQSVICVVERPSDVALIEEGAGYRGLYHVLHGLVTPLEDRGIHDLEVGALIRRLEGGKVAEIIVATSPTYEGDATAVEIANLVKPMGLKVTRIAAGIPVGSSLEFADSATLGRALQGRQTL